MVPDSFFSLLAFLGAVVPGLSFDLLADKRRAGADESTFREISRVVLFGSIFSAVSVSILAVIRTIEPGWMPNLRLVLSSEHSYLIGHYRLLLRTLAIEVALALILMFLTHLVLRKRSLSIDPRPAWQRVIRDECPDGQVPYVRARVSSGTSYEGRLLHYSPSTDSEKQEIVLTRPLHAKPATGTMAQIPGSWSALVLRGADITALHVRYEPIPPGMALMKRSSLIKALRRRH